jgi:hypothetical protein
VSLKDVQSWPEISRLAGETGAQPAELDLFERGEA